ncbi:MAG TPA: hypothetical protein VJ890_23400 [Vineibacter sp.]|nr:hypothetical protein [Vineibacter sp.]
MLITVHLANGSTKRIDMAPLGMDRETIERTLKQLTSKGVLHTINDDTQVGYAINFGWCPTARKGVPS